MSVQNKPVNQKAWFLILPVLICVAFSAIIPLMTVAAMIGKLVQIHTVKQYRQ